MRNAPRKTGTGIYPLTATLDVCAKPLPSYAIFPEHIVLARPVPRQSGDCTCPANESICVQHAPRLLQNMSVYCDAFEKSSNHISLGPLRAFAVDCAHVRLSEYSIVDDETRREPVLLTAYESFLWDDQPTSSFMLLSVDCFPAWALC